MSHIRKFERFETFEPISLPGMPKGQNSLGIPGLGQYPATCRIDADLARLLADQAPDYDDPELKKALRNLCFGTTTAAGSFTPMSTLLANLGGAVQNLPASWQFGGRQRTFGGRLTYATQVSGTILGLCRLPLFGVIVGITLVTDTSTATATLAIGDANSANVFVAASAYTAVDTPTRIGKTSAHFSQLLTGFDGLTGFSTITPGGGVASAQTAAPGSSGFGALYEDILVTTATASLPASGNLVIMVDYVLD